MTLLSLGEAQIRLCSGIAPLGTEQTDLDGALGRVLAVPIKAFRDQPPTALSAMDGYAVREQDLTGKRFDLIGESAAGRPFAGRIEKCQAVRIFTGAVVPAGADRVLVQEIVSAENGTVRLIDEPGRARFVRPAGLDFAVGETLLPGGTPLGPAQIALAAAANCKALTVFRRPKIAVLSTGDELVHPGGKVLDHQTIDAASYGVAAALGVWGAGKVDRVHAPDDFERLVDRLTALMRTVELAVTIGGASVGTHDVVRPAAERAGAELVFAGVAVRPGKPFWHARAKGTLIVGLPGNPASALVTARLLLAPLVGHLTGARDEIFKTQRRSRMRHPLPSSGRRETWHRGVLSDDGLTVDPRDDSSLLTPLSSADVLVRQPAGCALKEGEAVSYLSCF